MVALAHAPRGGAIGVDGRWRAGGEFQPFYVPRDVMPQVDEKDYDALIDFIRTQDAGPLFGVHEPRALRAHQRVIEAKVSALASGDRALLRKPVLISRDLFVLDGNHRWAAAVRLGISLLTIEVVRDFDAAIKLLFAFPKTYSYGDGTLHPITN